MQLFFWIISKIQILNNSIKTNKKHHPLRDWCFFLFTKPNKAFHPSIAQKTYQYPFIKLKIINVQHKNTL